MEHDLIYPEIGQNEIAEKITVESAAMTDGIAKPITFSISVENFKADSVKVVKIERKKKIFMKIFFDES